jgi:hypothetical protein
MATGHIRQYLSIFKQVIALIAQGARQSGKSFWIALPRYTVARQILNARLQTLLAKTRLACLGESELGLESVLERRLHCAMLRCYVRGTCATDIDISETTQYSGCGREMAAGGEIHDNNCL